MSSFGAWDYADKVLCVRLDALGDLLMTTPALRALKEALPGRQIGLLTSPAGAAAAALVPNIDEIITYEAPWTKSAKGHPDSRREYALVESLRRHDFQAAVVFTACGQSPLPAAMLCYLADIPLRLAQCRENPHQLLTHWVPDRESDRAVRHEVRRQLDLVANIGCKTSDERMYARVPPTAMQYVERLLDKLGIDRETPWVIMHPGAAAPARRYPLEGFARAARLLIRDLGCQVLFTGLEGDRELVQRIQDHMGVAVPSLVGRLSLSEFAALLALAPVLIANNTGPVQLAAALGTAVVDLYALTHPQQTPWGVPHRVLSHDVPCKYCYKNVCPEEHHQCLRFVAPEAIVHATGELLSQMRSEFGAVPSSEVDGHIDYPHLAEVEEPASLGRWPLRLEDHGPEDVMRAGEPSHHRT